MYLPAKVLEILRESKDVESYDSTIVHALVEAWDENSLIAVVQPNLGEKIKKGDFVVLELNAPMPGLSRFIIVKILRGSIAKTVWKAFKDKLDKMKELQKSGANQAKQMPMQFDIPELKSNMIG